jgi:hypothetical protein
MTLPQTPFGETFRFPVWDDDLAGDLGFTLADPAAPRLDLTVSAVARPQVLAFAPKTPNGGAMLVMAGGGYTQLVVGKEGVEIALWLNTLGYHAFVLIHRFPNAAERRRRRRSTTRSRRCGSFVLARPACGSIPNAWARWACRPAVTSPPAWPPTIPPPGPRPCRRRPPAPRPDALIVGYGPISTNAKGRTIVAGKPPLPPVEKQALYDALQPDAQLIAKLRRRPSSSTPPTTRWCRSRTACGCTKPTYDRGAEPSCTCSPRPRTGSRCGRRNCRSGRGRSCARGGWSAWGLGTLPPDRLRDRASLAPWITFRAVGKVVVGPEGLEPPTRPL